MHVCEWMCVSVCVFVPCVTKEVNDVLVRVCVFCVRVCVCECVCVCCIVMCVCVFVRVCGEVGFSWGQEDG